MWAKREDCNSGLAYGGNKTRKLEYLVPEALAQGADTLVSIGGHQSNHTRQVAAVAAHLGLQCVLVQENWVPEWTDPLSTQVGNILLSRVMGAEVRLDPAGFDIGFRDSWRQALEDVEKRGGTPYAIPAGASDHRLGGLGFANWAYEVAEQEAELGVFFDTIVVCTVTGSTHAGMIAGFAALEQAGGRPRRVLGIDASATLDKTRDQVGRIARSTAELIGLGRDLRDDEITVLEGWAGDVYGVPGAVDPRRDPAHRAARGRHPRHRSTRASRWPGSSTWCATATSRRTRRCSMPTSAASRPSTPTPACSEPSGYCSSELGSAGTSTACSRRASSGTMSSTDSCVEASTTGAATPSS